MAVEWKEPKTDWSKSDRFNFTDYNRIKNNLQYIYEQAKEIWGTFSIEDMGNDIESFTGNITARSINAFEHNLNTINQHVLTQDFGFSKTFFSNAPFIDADELNRIESATLSIKEMLDGEVRIVERLAFNLGRYKKIRA